MKNRVAKFTKSAKLWSTKSLQREFFTSMRTVSEHENLF